MKYPSTCLQNWDVCIINVNVEHVDINYVELRKWWGKKRPESSLEFRPTIAKKIHVFKNAFSKFRLLIHCKTRLVYMQRHENICIQRGRDISINTQWKLIETQQFSKFLNTSIIGRLMTMILQFTMILFIKTNDDGGGESGWDLKIVSKSMATQEVACII